MASLPPSTAALLSIHGPDTLVKLVRTDRTHRNVTYTALGCIECPEPFNTRECASGGLYGCELRHLLTWVTLDPTFDTVAVVRVPANTTVWFATKFKASALDVLAYVPLADVLTWLHHTAPTLFPPTAQLGIDWLIAFATRPQRVSQLPPVLAWYHATHDATTVQKAYTSTLLTTMHRAYPGHTAASLFHIGVLATADAPHEASPRFQRTHLTAAFTDFQAYTQRLTVNTLSPSDRRTYQTYLTHVNDLLMPTVDECF